MCLTPKPKGYGIGWRPLYLTGLLIAVGNGILLHREQEINTLVMYRSALFGMGLIRNNFCDPLHTVA